jgi:hypothetical protein
VVIVAMQISDQVNIPERLLQLLEENRLVVFTGAGVSMAPPTCLPSFEGLLDQIVTISGTSLSRRDNEPPDRYLGRLKQSGVNTHYIAWNIFNDPSIRANELHRNLLRLFRKGQRCRIITTNYDRNFSTAAGVLFGPEIPVHFAPSLPLGKDFNGIVYLHGTVDRDHSQLVLDDADFGRAYLGDAWATQFMVQVFAKYVVLFVGYSHNDPIMHYLTRGLSADTERYAIIPSGQEEKWSSLGITPISYPVVPPGDHTALDRCLVEWADFINSGYTEIKTFIESIMIADAPPTDVVTVDRLLWRTRDPVSLKLILDRADKASWVTWFYNKGVLDSVFNPVEPPKVELTLLVHWLAVKSTTTGSQQVLSIIQQSNMKFHPELWLRLVLHLSFVSPEDTEINSDTFSLWVQILISTAPNPQMASNLVKLFKSPAMGDAPFSFIALFAYLTKPTTILEPSFSVSRDYDVDIRLIADVYELREVWKVFLLPKLASFIHEVSPVIAHNLEATYVGLRSTGLASENFDPISYIRKSIESSSHSEIDHQFDVLIDAARDIIDFVVKFDSSMAMAIIEQWASHASPILKRLSLYGLKLIQTVSHDQKIRFLKRHNLCRFVMLHREVAELLRMSLAASKTKPTNELLGSMLKVLRQKNGNLKIEKLNICSILHMATQIVPEHPSILKTYQKAVKMVPEFDPVKHQILIDQDSTNQLIHFSPISSDDILIKTPDEVVDLVENDTLGFFLEPVAKAVSQHFEATWLWVERLIQSKEWSKTLWRDLLHAWSRVDLSETQWARIMSTIERYEEIGHFSDALATLLINITQTTKSCLPQSQFEQAERIAVQLWHRLSKTTSEPQPYEEAHQGWFQFARSQPGGKIASFLVQRLAEVYRDSSDKLAYIPEPDISIFNTMLRGESDAAVAGRVVLAHEIGYLYSLDPEWVKSTLIPHFMWHEGCDETPRQMWHGYLAAGQWSLTILPFMEDSYQKSFSHLSSDPSKVVRQQFFHHMAGLGLFSSRVGIPSWLNGFLHAIGEEGRVLWAENVARWLQPMSADAKRSVWDQWLRDYWRQRLDGIPVSITSGEANVMVHWVIEMHNVPPVYSESIDLLKRGPAPDLGKTRLMYEIGNRSLISLNPVATFDILACCLSGAGALSLPYYCSDIVEFIRAAKGCVEERLLHQMIDDLIRVGCDVPSDL